MWIQWIINSPQWKKTDREEKNLLLLSTLWTMWRSCSTVVPCAEDSVEDRTSRSRNATVPKREPIRHFVTGRVKAAGSMLSLRQGTARHDTKSNGSKHKTCILLNYLHSMHTTIKSSKKIFCDWSTITTLKVILRVRSGRNCTFCALVTVIKFLLRN